MHDAANFYGDVLFVMKVSVQESSTVFVRDTLDKSELFVNVPNFFNYLDARVIGHSAGYEAFHSAESLYNLNKIESHV